MLVPILICVFNVSVAHPAGVTSSYELMAREYQSIVSSEDRGEASKALCESLAEDAVDLAYTVNEVRS